MTRGKSFQERFSCWGHWLSIGYRIGTPEKQDANFYKYACFSRFVAKSLTLEEYQMRKVQRKARFKQDVDSILASVISGDPLVQGVARKYRRALNLLDEQVALKNLTLLHRGLP
mgnify:FL=1